MAVDKPQEGECPDVQLIPVRLAVLRAKKSDAVLRLGRMYLDPESESMVKGDPVLMLHDLIAMTEGDVAPTPGCWSHGRWSGRNLGDSQHLVISYHGNTVGRVMLTAGSGSSSIGLTVQPGQGIWARCHQKSARYSPMHG